MIQLVNLINGPKTLQNLWNFFPITNSHNSTIMIANRLNPYNHGIANSIAKPQSKKRNADSMKLNENKERKLFKHESNDLPIAAQKQAIISSVKKHMTTVVIGETGSGKSINF